MRGWVSRAGPLVCRYPRCVYSVDARSRIRYRNQHVRRCGNRRHAISQQECLQSGEHRKLMIFRRTETIFVS